MPRLIIRESGRERVVELDLDKITIGRSKANEVSILDEKASRVHCALERTEQGWFLVDLGSSNGTLLNGKLVQKQLVILGDIISIGGTDIYFERVIEEKPPAPPSAPPEQAVQPAQPQEAEAEFEEVEAVPVAEPEPVAGPEPAEAAPGRVQSPAPGDVSLHAAEGGARFFLKVVKGLSEGTSYPVGSLPFTIGRRVSSTISLEDDRVSGNHAQITREGSLWVLTDLGSTNGTLVGGRRIRREVLDHGTSFTIGSSTFQFVDIHGPELARVAHEGRPELAEPKDLPSEADLKIDVQKVLKRTRHDSLLILLYTVAGLFLIVSVAYFSFHVFGELVGSRGDAPGRGSFITENWSFEDWSGELVGVLPGWSVPGGGWALDQNHAKSGVCSLRLDCAINEESDQAIVVDYEGLEKRPISPDRQYQVRVQVKLDQARKAGVRVLWSDPLKPYFVQEEYSKLLSEGSGGWKTLRWTFTPPREARRMSLSLCAFGNTGSVWFDDVELYESEIEEGTRESQTVKHADQIEIAVDPRGRWSLYRLGVMTLWDAQVFLTDSEGNTSAFSQQALSGIERRAFVSGDSMRYHGQIYDTHDAGWKPFMQEIYSAEEHLTVHYKLSGGFEEGAGIGISFNAKPNIFSPDGVEVATAAGTQFWKGLSSVHGALEMVWGSGDNSTSFSFPKGCPVDIAVQHDKRADRVIISRQLKAGKDAEFIVHFSGVSLSQTEKAESIFSRIRALFETNRLQDAQTLVKQSRLDPVIGAAARKRLDKLSREIATGGEVLLKDMQSVYGDFKKSPHPDLLKSLGVSIKKICIAFPESEKGRDASDILISALTELQNQSRTARDRNASRMLLAAQKYRKKGMLGLAAVYLEHVRDNFPDTEWEKDAKSRLKIVESQSRTERRW